MCGICGVLINQAASIDDAGEPGRVVRRMTASLALRGPDASGHLDCLPAVLGHRRLRILELSEAGAQPMQLRSGGPAISFNGEIYNHVELRELLGERLGEPWRGRSDTEVILRAYQHWGLEGLTRLEGIFALAIWDPSQQRLVLMRDRLGVKPLFFGDSRLGLAFGSEIKAVLAAGGIDRKLDDQSFREYLWFGNTHEERTFHAGVRQLLPGQWLIAERGVRRIEHWFKIEEWLGSPEPGIRFDDASRVARASIDAAVHRQLAADVPVGLFLSGGLDSSAIAASAAAAGRTPRAFTATFGRERSINELPKARRVADHLRLPLHHLEIGRDSLWDAIERVSVAHDDPFADAANIPLFLLCRMLDGEVKVVLQGDGGDEVFGGYRRHLLLRNLGLLKSGPSILSVALRRGGSYGRRLARLLDSVRSPDAGIRMARLLTVNTPELPPESVLLPGRRIDLESCTDPFLAYRRAAARFDGHDPLQQMLLTDMTVQLPSQFLPKVDRATMAAGIEARVPLLDDLVVKAVIGMPSCVKVRPFKGKALLRAALDGRLPRDIVDGPKTGFGVPFEAWLCRELREGACERLMDPSFHDRFGLCRHAVESAVARHFAGSWGQGFLVWSLLQASIWSSRQRSEASGTPVASGEHPLSVRQPAS